jgi:hypothetical protein
MCNTLTEIEIERRLDAAGGSKFGPPHQRPRRRAVRGSNSWPATVTARRYQTQQIAAFHDPGWHGNRRRRQALRHKAVASVVRFVPSPSRLAPVSVSHPLTLVNHKKTVQIDVSTWRPFT